MVLKGKQTRIIPNIAMNGNRKTALVAVIVLYHARESAIRRNNMILTLDEPFCETHFALFALGNPRLVPEMP